MKRVLFSLVAGLLSLLLVEGFGHVLYRLSGPDGLWLFQHPDPGMLMSRPHPFLGSVGVPNTSRPYRRGTMSLNSMGYRGRDAASTRNGAFRVVAMGGSTTFGLGVSDDATWPVLLERILGEQFDVLNLGVAGYSTVENLVQTAFGLSDLAPAVAVYFLGWNDLHSSHVVDLDPYYESFHAQLQTAGFVYRNRPAYSALRYYAGILANGPESPPPLPSGRVEHGLVDPRAMALYRRNLHSIAALCRSQHIQPVFVPNIFDCTRVAGDTKSDEWSPFVKNSELCDLASAYAETMAEVALQEDIRFVAEIRTPGLFDPTDFVDVGHFSVSGNTKFATMLAPIIRELKAARE
jgi:lysophospholipase L1-like esterase